MLPTEGTQTFTRVTNCGTIRQSIQKATRKEAGGRKGVFLSYQAETPFDNIEGSHEYVKLLAEAIDEARREVEAEIASADRDGADRRKEALLLVSYNLAKLNLHITGSRRILNDLRTLRRLLLAERGVPVVENSRAIAAEDAG
jgi:hypothetical protein